MGQKNLAMAWIEYKKVFHIATQSWKINCLKMYKVLDEVMNFTEKTMKTWREELTTRGKSLVEAKFQRGIFSRDVLSSLQFGIAMMPFNHIFRKCTGTYIYYIYIYIYILFAKNEKDIETLMHAVRINNQNIGLEFGLEKYAKLIMKGEKHLTDEMELPNQEKIRPLGEKETYKYLGILETDTIKQVEMKEKIKKEYLRRTRKLLKTKQYNRNLITGINNWADPLVTYSGLFLKWTREELRQMNQSTRKLTTMHKALHPWDDVDRLYVSRKEGGRGLTSTEDTVDASIQLEDYIEKNRLIKDTRNKINNTRINTTETTRKQKWEEKQFNGLTSEISLEKTWTKRKGKPWERNRISSNSSTKQRHKDQSYQRKNK